MKQPMNDELAKCSEKTVKDCISLCASEIVPQKQVGSEKVGIVSCERRGAAPFAPAHQTTAAQRVRNIQRSIMFLIMTLFWFALYAHVPYQTKFLENLGINAGRIGLTVGMYGIAQFLLRLPLGMTADRTRNFMRYVVLGASLTLVTALLRLAFPTANGTLLANFLAGFAATNWIVLLVYYLSLYPSMKLQFGMTTATLAFAIGQMMATAIGSWVFGRYSMLGLAQSESIAAFIATSLAVGLYLFLRTMVKRGVIDRPQAGLAQRRKLKRRQVETGENAIQTAVNTTEQKPSSAIPTYRTLLRSLWHKRTIGFAFLAFIQQGLIMTTALSFTTKHAVAIGANEVEIGYATLLFLGVTVGVTFLLATPPFIRIGSKRLLPFFLGLAALYCFLLPMVTSIGGLYAMQILGGVFSGGTLPLILTEAMVGVKEEQRMTAMGFVQGILAGGFIVIPPLTGLLIEYYNLQTAFYLLAIATSFVTLYTLYLFHSLAQAAGSDKIKND